MLKTGGLNHPHGAVHAYYAQVAEALPELHRSPDSLASSPTRVSNEGNPDYPPTSACHKQTLTSPPNEPQVTHPPLPSKPVVQTPDSNSVRPRPPSSSHIRRVFARFQEATPGKPTPLLTDSQLQVNANPFRSDTGQLTLYNSYRSDTDDDGDLAESYFQAEQTRSRYPRKRHSYHFDDPTGQPPTRRRPRLPRTQRKSRSTYFPTVRPSALVRTVARSASRLMPRSLPLVSGSRLTAPVALQPIRGSSDPNSSSETEESDSNLDKSDACSAATDSDEEEEDIPKYITPNGVPYFALQCADNDVGELTSTASASTQDPLGLDKALVQAKQPMAPSALTRWARNLATLPVSLLSTEALSHTLYPIFKTMRHLRHGLQVLAITRRGSRRKSTKSGSVSQPLCGQLDDATLSITPKAKPSYSSEMRNGELTAYDCANPNSALEEIPGSPSYSDPLSSACNNADIQTDAGLNRSIAAGTASAAPSSIAVVYLARSTSASSVPSLTRNSTRSSASTLPVKAHGLGTSIKRRFSRHGPLRALTGNQTARARLQPKKPSSSPSRLELSPVLS
ncbi:hypothetical protein IWQ62_001225 [Dispira parvispora]|uniref:Uncharacterized protein n=1 Tax=Dispira parvispora TaxID=1520584 RepID=A0A9W8AVJ0_9FUNG|nr:hypothetical protein IWQ62_001225 [Dispira parvispora]